MSRLRFTAKMAIPDPTDTLMNFTNLLYSVDAGIATITVNRPDKLNALNQATVRELEQAFLAAKADPVVRVVVMAGSGPKADSAVPQKRWRR